MTDTALVINKMIEYYQNDAKRINHFFKGIQLLQSNRLHREAGRKNAVHS